MRHARQVLTVFLLAALPAVPCVAAAATKPLKVFLLAGQSNMQGHAKVSTSEHIGMDPATKPMLPERLGADGKPKVCERVWISSSTPIPIMAKPIIEIRQAVSADTEKLVDFNIALCRETEQRDLDRVTVSAGVRRFVSEPARGRYFVALIAGEVVGQTAHTFEWSDWRNGEIWWIQSVYVHPLHRGRGVFGALFAHIKELGEKDAECCGIRLYMERENETARQSYLRLGFIETGYEVFENLFPTSD